MQERNLREIRRRPAIIVRDTVPVLVRVDPALRYELLPVFAPEERAPIDRPRTQHHSCPFRDVLPCYDGVAD